MLRRKIKVLITHWVLVSVLCVHLHVRMSVKSVYLELILKFRALGDMMPYPCIDSYRHVGENTEAGHFKYICFLGLLASVTDGS